LQGNQNEHTPCVVFARSAKRIEVEKVYKATEVSECPVDTCPKGKARWSWELLQSNVTGKEQYDNKSEWGDDNKPDGAADKEPCE